MKNNLIKTEMDVNNKKIGVIRVNILELWEKLNNDNFKCVEFDTLKNEAGILNMKSKRLCRC